MAVEWNIRVQEFGGMATSSLAVVMGGSMKQGHCEQGQGDPQISSSQCQVDYHPSAHLRGHAVSTRILVRKESRKQGDRGGLRNSGGGTPTLWGPTGARSGLRVPMVSTLLRVREVSQREREEQQEDLGTRVRLVYVEDSGAMLLQSPQALKMLTLATYSRPCLLF